MTANTTITPMTARTISGRNLGDLLTEAAHHTADLANRGARIAALTVVPRAIDWMLVITYADPAADRERYIKVSDLAALTYFEIGYLRGLLAKYSIQPQRGPGWGHPQYILEEEAAAFIAAECPGIRLDLEKLVHELRPGDFPQRAAA